MTGDIELANPQLDIHFHSQINRVFKFDIKYKQNHGNGQHKNLIL